MWEYTTLPDHHKILSEEAKGILDEIFSGSFDIVPVLKDSRSIHRRLFHRLTPTGYECFAGGYRGADGVLKDIRVTVLGNTIVGFPPDSVHAAMERFAQDAEREIAGLDTAHQDSELSGEHKLLTTVRVACELVAKFFLIHPYVNGNGHVGRLLMKGILARYKYQMRDFDLHPRPPGATYSQSIATYQKAMLKKPDGNLDDFPRYILGRLK